MTILLLYIDRWRYKDLCISQENEVASELYLSILQFFLVGDIGDILTYRNGEIYEFIPIRSSTMKLSSGEMRTGK